MKEPIEVYRAMIIDAVSRIEHLDDLQYIYYLLMELQMDTDSSTDREVA